MFSLLSKLQKGANAKMWKRLFHATDFESLMYPSFTFCYILGIFPYKINASAFGISKPRYIISTVVMCVCFIGLLSSLYMMDICGIPKSTGVPRTLERNCYYILSGFAAVVTYILSGPRMRLLQSIMEISWKLPPESYQKLSRLIHAKDTLGSLFLVIQISIYFTTNIHIILKLFVAYVVLVVFHMDMMYMNCVCVLKACFKQINDNLEHIRDHMINDEVYHLDRMHYKQRSPVLLIKLKALEKQHRMISDAVQRMNMIFSLQLLVTIILTFIEITFQLYFRIVYWLKDISVIMLDDDIYEMMMIIFITYHFTKIMMIVWACESTKNQALQIGTTVHDAFNSTGDNEIKSELQLFSLQILHRKNIFSAMGLTVDASLLTAMVGNISTYLLILIQFLNMKHFCAKEIATNVTEIIQ
ncbi:gustatory receptor 23a-like [Temnothorax curvispinosus]|uniref:Gustatory receptor n=1 Tax=Temnothorax curvispinosus TaxID=300111 RepID=A0A6J1QVB1_9HYME|nr:gustatory receptor 23a-like [Temnothorax curvispinosus]